MLSVALTRRQVLAGRKEKPDAGIFLRACELAGCRPDEVLRSRDQREITLAGHACDWPPCRHCRAAGARKLTSIMSTGSWPQVTTHAGFSHMHTASA